MAGITMPVDVGVMPVVGKDAVINKMCIRDRFNALAGENISIVKDTPGVTRDRIYADVTWLNHSFTIIDTGGIEPESSDVILSQMREQALIAMDTADVIIFLTDVRQGLVDSDAKVADMLRRSSKPVVLAVNKVDHFERQMMDVYEFYNLGIGEPVPISAEGKQGLGDLLDQVAAHFEDSRSAEEGDEIPKVAIVGKPNVGKSSIINKLLGQNRVIVSDVAGTTRDAIDTTVRWNGKDYVFIDTAGLRRKSKVREELERYSIIRTVTAVERADVVIVVIDAVEGITDVYKRQAPWWQGFPMWGNPPSSILTQAVPARKPATGRGLRRENSGFAWARDWSFWTRRESCGRNSMIRKWESGWR